MCLQDVKVPATAGCMVDGIMDQDVAPPLKVRAVRSSFPLLGGVNLHQPGKIINKKYEHNPGLRGAGGF